MQMSKLINYVAVLPFILSVVASCTSVEEKTPQKPDVKVVLPEPFHFHKAIEVKPGLTFDVVSWGRGSELESAFLILRSDSSGMKYRSTSGELEGRINDAWNMDMDSDGNPEIFIESKGVEKGNYLNMYVYEFDDNGTSRELRFPDLTSSTKENYRGKDSLYVKEGILYREFPLYDVKDTAGVKPTGKKILEYSLRGNDFSVSTKTP
ncbi:hypothetical protein BDE36_3250 [Arcticibacter tournemirensis]|nr:hypothetical protein BDE36_3250 [Arcticibacter tournemirensis]